MKDAIISAVTNATPIKPERPTLIRGDQINALAPSLDLVETLRQSFLIGASVPQRIHYDLKEGAPPTLLIMPAWRVGRSIGVKVVTVIPENAARGRSTIGGAYMLLDGLTGEPLAVFDAAALTQVRTAAVSALGATVLARKDAHTLLMVGTGALAPYLIRALVAVRPIDMVLIWGRSPIKAQRLAENLGDLGCKLAVTNDLRQAVRQADIISCATLSNRPLILKSDVKLGVHVDLVGSFKPSMREADDDLVCSGRLVVDSWTALDESGDLIGPLSKGLLHRNAISSLEQVLANPGLGRRTFDEVTVFKAVGTALSDLAVAELLFKHHTRKVAD